MSAECKNFFFLFLSSSFELALLLMMTLLLTMTKINFFNEWVEDVNTSSMYKLTKSWLKSSNVATLPSSLRPLFVRLLLFNSIKLVCVVCRNFVCENKRKIYGNYFVEYEMQGKLRNSAESFSRFWFIFLRYDVLGPRRLWYFSSDTSKTR